MEPELVRRALDAFDAISPLPPERRAAWAAESRAADPALYGAVMALLLADQRAAMMPTTPPVPIPPADALALPARIGPYQLTDLIGEGGMGRVFRAERADGHFEQVVAIKITAARLLAGTASEQFRIERQILANMHHPNIAQLFDGGVAEDGRSYLVMELIEGQPITVHADASKLSFGDRLGLMIEVCAAVQHAHQQLVVHADIKPGNVLIDRRYGVKLVDFGIGALLGARSADAVICGARTPEWSSPQLQAGESPTPADDIYALGLLLKTLTAGFEGGDDLAVICRKAMAAMPTDRYASADALAEDVQRLLRHFPIAALPPSKRRDLVLFCRRHRPGIALVSAIAIGLVAALVVTTSLYLRGETARRQAQQRFEEVRALSRYMLNDEIDSLAKLPGTSGLRHDLAVRGRRYLEGLSRIPDASIELRLETAEGYAKTGEILGRPTMMNAGDPVAGRASLARAEHALRGLSALLPRRDDIRIDLAHTLIVEANVALVSFNDQAGTVRFLDAADRALDGIAPGSAMREKVGWTRWEGRNVRAGALNMGARFAEMVPLLDRALHDGRALPVPAARADERVVREAASLHLLGDARYYLHDEPGALSTYKAAVAILERRRQGSTNAVLFDLSAYGHYEVASTLSSLGRPTEALPWIDKASAIIDLLHAFDQSPRTDHVRSVVMLARAENLGQLGRFAEALVLMRRNITERQRASEREPANYEARRAVPVSYRPLAVLYFAAGQSAAACRTLREARALWAALALRAGLGGYDQTDEKAELAALERRCPR